MPDRDKNEKQKDERDEGQSEQEEAEEMWETTKGRGERFADSLVELCEEGHVEHFDEVMLDEVRDQVEIIAFRIADALDEFEEKLEDERDTKEESPDTEKKVDDEL